MDNSTNSCLILLTYKRKILLLQKDDLLHNLSHNGWHFIKIIKDKDLSFQEAIIREVERETNIKLSDVTLIVDSSDGTQRQYFFHANLTDNNVNNIQRAEGNVLQFFELKELNKIKLDTSTEFLLTAHKTAVENLSLN